MATKLTKDVTRETYSVTNRKGELAIVTLKAGDMLEFRFKGRRTRYSVPLQSCMYMALIQHLHDEYNAKMKRYNDRKKLGLRTKRPKKPVLPYSKKLFDALNM